MSNKRNQHFVPKVHLRPFASDENERCINIWLHHHDKIVSGASIRSQCSKSYFYGTDLVLDELFEFPEQVYGKVKNKVLSGEKLSENDLSSLLFFWLVQHLRAERAIALNVYAMSLMREKILLGHEEDKKVLDYLGAPMTEEEAAKIALFGASTYIDSISDLKKTILKNMSNVPFVTSDNPAIGSNRLIIQRYAGRKNWGLTSAGYYLYLPISPNFAFLAYDANVYDLNGRKGSLCQVNRRDVHALNQLIFLNSDNCIFFNDASSIDEVANMLRSVADLRSESLFRVNTAVLEEGDPSTGYQRFKVADDEAFKNASRGLLHLESLPPLITRHLPKLRYKHAPRYINTRSAAGWIRHNLNRRH